MAACGGRQTAHHFVANHFMTQLENGNFFVVPKQPTAETLAAALFKNNAFRWTRDEVGKRFALRVLCTTARRFWAELRKIKVHAGQHAIDMALDAASMLRRLVPKSALLVAFQSDFQFKNAVHDFQRRGGSAANNRTVLKYYARPAARQGGRCVMPILGP